MLSSRKRPSAQKSRRVALSLLPMMSLAACGGGGSGPNNSTVNRNTPPANNAPTDITLSAAEVAENTSGVVDIATVTVTDADSSDTHTYTVSDDRFEIVSGVLRLKASASLDYETILGSGSSATISIDITANDGNGGSYTETFTITVTDTNDAPTDIELSNNSVDENASGAVIGDITVVDQDASDSFTFIVSDDRFEVVDGQLKLKEGESLDFETEETVTVDVTVTDSAGATYTESFEITVNDVAEVAARLIAPSENLSLTAGKSDQVISVLEFDQQIRDGSLDNHTFRVSDERFYVDSNGQLILKEGAVFDNLGESVEIIITSEHLGNDSTVLSGHKYTIDVVASVQGGENADNLTGTSQNDSFNGKGGVDTITTGTGNDIIYVEDINSQITINDFDPDHDVIHLKSLNLDFNNLTVSQSGSDTVITYDDLSITLKGIDSDTITGDSFIDIRDYDRPVITAYDVNEDTSDNIITLTLELSNPYHQPVTVSYNGADIPTGSITFAPGETSKTIDFNYDASDVIIATLSYGWIRLSSSFNIKNISPLLTISNLENSRGVFYRNTDEQKEYIGTDSIDQFFTGTDTGNNHFYGGKGGDSVYFSGGITTVTLGEEADSIIVGAVRDRSGFLTVTDFDGDTIDLSVISSLLDLSADPGGLQAEDLDWQDTADGALLQLPTDKTILFQGVSVSDVISTGEFIFPIVGTSGHDNLSGIGESLEYIYGGAGDDVLHGNARIQRLFGGKGDDILNAYYDSDDYKPSVTFYGGSGDDVFEADDGLDARISYIHDPSGIVADIPSGFITDGYGDTDFFSQIDKLYATYYDDYVVSSAEITLVYTYSGDDIVIESGAGLYASLGAGNDSLDGSFTSFDEYTGNEVGTLVDYGRATPNGIHVDFSQNAALDDGYGTSDTLISIEHIVATMHDDIIVAGDNLLIDVYLDDGDDHFTGNDLGTNIRPGGGDDVIIAGDGIDRLDYSFKDPAITGFNSVHEQGIFADLNTGYVIDFFGDLDLVSGVEEVIGTDLDDHIIGDDADNFLSGNKGDDILNGGLGDDRLVGGDGHDQFVFDGNWGNDVIEDFDIFRDDIDLSNASISSYSDLSIRQSGADVIIEDGSGNSITLLNISVDHIGADNFIF